MSTIEHTPTPSIGQRTIFWDRLRISSAVTTPFLLVLLPLLFFLSFFNPAILDIGNPGWLIHGTYNSDNGENALGAHAYWHDPNAGASLRTTLLNAPEGVPVLYTDSNPLITLLVKPFATLLPANAQLVGPSIFLNLVLQALFAWLLLRRHAPGPIALWAGVALLAFPPTLANRFMHANLMAHWTILAALLLFLDTRRSRKVEYWAALITVTTLIHSYLLFMVAAIWGSALLVEFTQGTRRAKAEAAGKGVALLALVLLLATWLGVGDQMTTGTFGHFSMPLDAIWNPGLSGFSTLLPHRDVRDGDWFEGFQYLGAGSLLLIAAALVIARQQPARADARETAARLRGLVPALIVLTMLAILPPTLPTPILTILDPLRASGRLFWPVGYVLMLMALLAAYRLPSDRAGLLMIGVVSIQALDLIVMAQTVRLQSREAANHQLYQRTQDPRWDRLIAQSRSIAFFPGDVTRDLGLFQEVSWRAVNAGRPVANVYAARDSRATTARLRAQRAAFERGEYVPGRMYIFLANMRPSGDAASRMISLDGVSIIPPEPLPRR